MKKYEEQLTPEALLLNKYLGQYRRCIDRKKCLERRRNEIIREFEYPLRAVSYNGTHSSGVNPGCAALAYRLDEIDCRINEQMSKSVKVLAEIMDIIEFLPENSDERSIIEHKYIDRMSWERICAVEHISRTPATRHWRKGLYQLLEFKKVKQILKEYAKTLDGDFVE